LLTELEKHVAKLQEVLQAKEDEFRDVVKVGRTELTDAVPMTLFELSTGSCTGAR